MGLRRFHVILLLLLVLVMLQPQAQAERLMQQGNDAYLRGDYPAAAALYEQVLLEGAASYPVYYNLATTYYQMRQLGEAMLYYRRAERLSPRDPALNANLARLRAERVDFQGDHVALVDQLASLTQSTLTLVELGFIVLLLWSVWFGWALGWLLLRRRRSTLVILLAITSVVVLIGLGLFVPRAYADAQRPEAVVTALSAPVYSGPAPTYFEMFQVFAGAEIRILETRAGWARLILPDGREGWVEGSLIAFI